MSTSNDSSELYELLGIEPGASLSQVKHAYRRLVADYEAGVAGFDEDELARIERAYEQLRDELSQPPNTASTAADTDEKRPAHKPFVSVPWGPLLALVVAALAFLGGELLALQAVTVFVMAWEGVAYTEAVTAATEEDDVLLFASYALGSLLALAIIYGFVRLRGGSWQTLGIRGSKISTALFVIFVGIVGYYIGATTVFALSEWLLPQVDLDAQQDIPFQPVDGLELGLTFIAIVVLAPVVEEVLFRGFLLPAFNRVMRLPFAVILVSIIFALLHPPLSAMLAIGIFSILLCWAYIKSKSLWPPILLHALQNSIAFTLLFVLDIQQFAPENDFPAIITRLLGV